MSGCEWLGYVAIAGLSAGLSSLTHMCNQHAGRAILGVNEFDSGMFFCFFSLKNRFLAGQAELTLEYT